MECFKTRCAFGGDTTTAGVLFFCTDGFTKLGAATVPELPVTTTIDGYFLGLPKRSFQAA